MFFYRSFTRFIILFLLLGVACSCAQIPVVKAPEGPFSVSPEITYLLDSPGNEGNVLGSLYKGDKVEMVDTGESHWWRVKLQRSGQVGWVREGVTLLWPGCHEFLLCKRGYPASSGMPSH